MAKGRKTGGRDFGPGHRINVGNETYKNAQIKPDTALLKSFTRDQIISALCACLNMPVSQLDEVCLSSEASSASVMMASITQKAILQGCERRAAFLMSYIVGKPKEIDESLDREQTDPLARFRGVPSDVLTNLMDAMRLAAAAQQAVAQADR